MSEKKVYGLGQWLECHGNIGRVIAKSLSLLNFECTPGAESDADINTPANNGRGYCVAWGEVVALESGDTFSPRRHRWIREDTIQDPRYKAIECPLKPVPASIGGAEIQPAKDEAPQPALPLDVDAAIDELLCTVARANELVRDIRRARGETA